MLLIYCLILIIILLKQGVLKLQVEVCFNCQEYVEVFPNYEGKQIQNKFESKHQTHPVQVVDETELDDSYSNVTSDFKED